MSESMLYNKQSNKSASAKIRIENLEVFAYHGVLPEEKENGQTFFVSLDLYFDSYLSGTYDTLEDTINYAEICNLTSEFMTSKKYDLIEAVAENLAEFLLTEFKLIDTIDVEIKKPDAPIDLPFEYVSIQISRKWHVAYLGIGSNLGEKEDNINYAVDLLKKNPKIRSLEMSKIIETEPYGPVEQDNFLNACIKIETIYHPRQLLMELSRVELQTGREPSERWGPRVLDLDILIYDDLIMESEDLTIPHMDMHNRAFVLDPLNDIAPDLVHPVYMKTIKELFDDC